MIEVEKCNICESTNLTLVKDKLIFNPDTDKEELIPDVYICNTCKCIHVEGKDFSFIQIEINKDKSIQKTNFNSIGKWTNKT